MIRRTVQPRLLANSWGTARHHHPRQLASSWGTARHHHPRQLASSWGTARHHHPRQLASSWGTARHHHPRQLRAAGELPTTTTPANLRAAGELPATTAPADLRGDGNLRATPNLRGDGNLRATPNLREDGNVRAAPPPPSAEKGTPGGYAAGIYDRQGGEQETGLLQDVLFNRESNSVSFGISGGEKVLLQFDDEGDPISASATRNGEPLDIIQFKSQTQLTQSKELICSNCDFLRWGKLDVHLNYRDTSNLFAGGWWVAGELTTVSDIDTLAALGANATYNGSVQGTVINAGEIYDASGGLTMNWSFAGRSGDLNISNFDQRSYSTGPNGLSQPTRDVNQFGGSLKQTEGPDIGLRSGSVTGSFVNNGSVAAGGVMGKWGVDGANYRATGVLPGDPGHATLDTQLRDIANSSRLPRRIAVGREQRLDVPLRARHSWRWPHASQQAMMASKGPCGSLWIECRLPYWSVLSCRGHRRSGRHHDVGVEAREACVPGRPCLELVCRVHSR